jgi:DNA-binding NarL/FixJ family response regulator
VLAGEIYASEKLAATILQKVAGRQTAGGGSPTDVLTDRELEVFQLLGQGKTVEGHREHRR